MKEKRMSQDPVDGGPTTESREEKRVETTETVQETPQPVATTVTETAQTVTETAPAEGGNDPDNGQDSNQQ